MLRGRDSRLERVEIENRRALLVDDRLERARSGSGRTGDCGEDADRGKPQKRRRSRGKTCAEDAHEGGTVAQSNRRPTPTLCGPAATGSTSFCVENAGALRALYGCRCPEPLVAC